MDVCLEQTCTKIDRATYKISIVAESKKEKEEVF
jgi:hypothetical protein